MSHDTMKAMKKYIKLLEDKGLHRICGKDVTVAEKEIVTECVWSSEVGSSTDETVIDVLTGVMNFSVPDFVNLFDFLLKVKTKAHDIDAHEGRAHELFKIISIKAVDAYHSLYCRQVVC